MNAEFASDRAHSHFSACQRRKISDSMDRSSIRDPPLERTGSRTEATRDKSIHRTSSAAQRSRAPKTSKGRWNPCRRVMSVPKRARPATPRALRPANLPGAPKRWNPDEPRGLDEGCGTHAAGAHGQRRPPQSRGASRKPYVWIRDEPPKSIQASNRPDPDRSGCRRSLALGNDDRRRGEEASQRRRSQPLFPPRTGNEQRLAG
jgi:hypothetical protein